MNIDKVVCELRRLGSSIRISGARLVLGELFEHWPKLQITGLMPDSVVDLVDCLGPENIPEVWKSNGAIQQVGPDECTPEALEAAREELERRINVCGWFLTLSNETSRNTLVAQGVDAITRLEVFKGVSFRLIIRIPAIQYRSVTIQPIPLFRFLPDHQIQAIFSESRS